MIKVLKLNEHMRVLNNGDDTKLKEFDKWLEQLGEGKIPYLDEYSDTFSSHKTFVLKSTSSQQMTP